MRLIISCYVLHHLRSGQNIERARRSHETIGGSRPAPSPCIAIRQAPATAVTDNKTGKPPPCLRCQQVLHRRVLADQVLPIALQRSRRPGVVRVHRLLPRRQRGSGDGRRGCIRRILMHQTRQVQVQRPAGGRYGKERALAKR